MNPEDIKDINKADQADEDTGHDEESTMNPNVRTQITCNDLEVVQTTAGEGGVSEEEVEEAVVKINPDINSMDSRG